MNTVSADLSRREMYAEIRKLCVPNNFTNWRILLQEYVTYALLVAICMVTYSWIVTHGWSRWWILPVYMLIVLAIGLWTQNRLSCLVHESSHFLLFKNRLLNDVAANLLVCFPFFAAPEKGDSKKGGSLEKWAFSGGFGPAGITSEIGGSCLGQPLLHS